MKVYRVYTTRRTCESVPLTITAESKEAVIKLLKSLDTDDAIDQFAKKDIDGDYPEWEMDDYISDPEIDLDPTNIEEVKTPELLLNYYDQTDD